MALRALIVIVLIGLAGGYARELGANRSFVETMPDLAGLPATIGEWRSEDFPISDTVAEVLAADVILQRRYYTPHGREVWLFLAYFASQTVNSQIHSPRHCIPGSGWQIVSHQQRALSLPGGDQSASAMVIQRNQQENEMLYWFRTRSGTVTGEYALKWDLVKNSLARRPTDAVFVRYNAAKAQADALQELMTALDPHLNRMLEEVGL